MINIVIGILLIGLSSAGMGSSLGLLMLANDSTNLKDFRRRHGVAVLTLGMFGAMAAVGIAILFGLL